MWLLFEFPGKEMIYQVPTWGPGARQAGRSPGGKQAAAQTDHTQGNCAPDSYKSWSRMLSVLVFGWKNWGPPVRSDTFSHAQPAVNRPDGDTQFCRNLACMMVSLLPYTHT